MQRRLIATTLLVAASLLTPAVQAQSKKELVGKILALQKPQYEQFGNAITQGQVQPMLQRAALVLRERVAEDKREAVGKAMDAELRAYVADVSPKMRASAVKHAAEIVGGKLESSFNEAELKQLLQYLESPVVNRYNQLSAEFPQALAQKVGAENRGLVEARAKQLESKLADLLGIKPSAPAPDAGSKP